MEPENTKKINHRFRGSQKKKKETLHKTFGQIRSKVREHIS